MFTYNELSRGQQGLWKDNWVWEELEWTMVRERVPAVASRSFASAGVEVHSNNTFLSFSSRKWAPENHRREVFLNMCGETDLYDSSSREKGGVMDQGPNYYAPKCTSPIFIDAKVVTNCSLLVIQSGKDVKADLFVEDTRLLWKPASAAENCPISLLNFS